MGTTTIASRARMLRAFPARSGGREKLVFLDGDEGCVACASRSGSQSLFSPGLVFVQLICFAWPHEHHVRDRDGALILAVRPISSQLAPSGGGGGRSEQKEEENALRAVGAASAALAR